MEKKLKCCSPCGFLRVICILGLPFIIEIGIKQVPVVALATKESR
jgi:hypothetical protein